MVHRGSEGLGTRAMGQDFGLDLRPHLYVDASAAICIAQRKGLGKVRHLDTQSLWIQDALREKRLHLHKVPGAENPGDMMTKALDAKTLDKLVEKVGMLQLEGRAKSAPQLTKDYGGDPGEDGHEGGDAGGQGPGC